MIQVKDIRSGKEKIWMPETEVKVVIKSNAVITVNGKYIIRTGTGNWVRQDAVYTDAEIDAAKQITKRLDENRK